jgi:hypothetical protein
MSQAGLAVKATVMDEDLRLMRTKGIRLRLDHNMLSPGRINGLNP